MSKKTLYNRNANENTWAPVKETKNGTIYHDGDGYYYELAPNFRCSSIAEAEEELRRAIILSKPH